VGKQLGRLAPRIDDDSQSWWEGLREHRVVLQECDDCGRRRFPPMPSCPFDGTVGHTEVEVDARGRVYSWVTVHRALTAAQADQVPYTVAVIELDGGPRLLGRLDGQPGDGVPVAPVFVDHDWWTELRFEVTT
jgi:uncharacterized OB-fold protein